MSGGDDDLRSELRRYIMSRAPGMLMTLNIHAEQRFGKDFVELCFTDLDKAMELIKEIYADELVARIIYDVLIKRRIRNGASGGGAALKLWLLCC